MTVRIVNHSIRAVTFSSRTALRFAEDDVLMTIRRWNPAYGVAGAGNLYIELMEALFDINKDMLFLIQGPGPVNLTGVGGSSYVTNIPNAYINDNRDSDPNSFFKQLLIKPYVAQVENLAEIM